MTASTVGAGALVVGYALAVPVCVRLVPVMREKRTRWFGVLQIGTALIVAGHAMQDRTPAAVVNAGFFVAFVAAWLLVPRRDPVAGERL